MAEWDFSKEVISEASEITIGSRVAVHWSEAECQDQEGTVVGVRIERNGKVEYAVHIDGDISPTDEFTHDRSGLEGGTIRLISPAPPMTNDKAREAAARGLAANYWSVDSGMDKQAYQDANWQFHVDDAGAAIAAHLSALPGEAEVVGYLNWSEVHQRRYFDDSPRGQREAWPLVTLASLQAMQARAEAAEREIARMTPKFVAYEYLESPAGREAAEARVKELEEAIDRIADFDVDGHLSPDVVHLIRIAGAARRTALSTGGSNG